MVIPEKWPGPQKPMCIHMAKTGDHAYWQRRLTMCKPLALKHGIGSINLVNPYYGARKPPDQFRSFLKNVTDLFVMGGSLIFEGMTLLNWCSKQGFGPLCVTGISLGGHMASLSAGHYPHPVALVPCLSWSTASQCFTDGVLSKALDWKMLKETYYTPSFQRELAKKVPSLYHSEYGLGRYFAANFEEMGESSKVEPFRWSRHIKHSINKSSSQLTEQEVLDFMRGMMDEFTHLTNYPLPVDPSLVIAVEALHDAYIPREGVMDLRELYPGCEVRYFNAGHVTSSIYHTDKFREAIVDALARATAKYHTDEIKSSETLLKTKKPDLVVPPA